MNITPRQRLERRRSRVRAKILGTANRPRLSVYRSLRHISAQLIDDVKARTLVAAKDTDIPAGKRGKDLACEVGKLLASRAQEQKITAVVFDRGGREYHGRIQALAEGVRDGGLKF